MAVLKGRKKVLKKGKKLSSSGGKKDKLQLVRKIKKSKRFLREEAGLEKKVQKELLASEVEIPKGNIALHKNKETSFKAGNRKVKKEIKKKGTAKKSSEAPKKGIICLTNIPHGFYEKQMLGYFSQFGKVTNVRLIRSEKTGRSCGYGYVEFLFDDVAIIAADAMDNYLTFNKIMKCRFIEHTKSISEQLFSVEPFNEKNCPKVLRRVNAIREKNARRSREKMSEKKLKIATNFKKKLDVLKSLGVDVDLKMDLDGLSKNILRKRKEDNIQNQSGLETLEPLETADEKAEKQEIPEANNLKVLETRADEKVEKQEISEANEATAISADAEVAPSIQENEVIFEADESDDEIVLRTPPFAKKKLVKITPSSPALRVTDTKSQLSHSIKKTLAQELSSVTTSKDTPEFCRNRTPLNKKTPKTPKVKKSSEELLASDKKNAKSVDKKMPKKSLAPDSKSSEGEIVKKELSLANEPETELTKTPKKSETRSPVTKKTPKKTLASNENKTTPLTKRTPKTPKVTTSSSSKKFSASEKKNVTQKRQLSDVASKVDGKVKKQKQKRLSL